MMKQNDTDSILGITRCARCGHRLDGEIECPFCSVFPLAQQKARVPKWVYITACFLLSPLSLFALLKTDRLNFAEKTFSFSGCFLWLGVYQVWL